ncbi:MAG: amino acid ABC transporter substrate-binding protein [Burkholderiales bacterium]|nr:amino acid ABC transporter substrate-binding protein [Burkholderiales bacterium]
MRPLRLLSRLVATAVLAGAALGASAADESTSPTLRKIRDTGLITLGYRDASVPFSYLDAKRRPVGYSLDLCHRVVAAVRERLKLPGLEVRHMLVSSATRFPLVANGTVDIECGVTTNTAERQRSVAFSLTTFVAASRLLVREDSSISSIEDLRGQPVASTLATTSIQFLNSLNRSRALEMRILAGLDDVEGMRMVLNGRAVAYAMDDVLLYSMKATHPAAASLRIAPLALTTEPYALVLRKDDTEFKQLVDGVLARLYRSGEIEALYQRWFEQPIEPRGITLKMPISDALRRVIRQPTDTADPSAYQ